MTWRRVAGGTGRVLILAGVLLLLFVAYQLWGTGLAEARAQDRLRDQFEASLSQAGGDPDRSTTSSTSQPADEPDATTSTSEPGPPPAQGDAVAQVRIPKIGVDKTVVEGVTVKDLKKGPGHYPRTPMPGQPGNAAIAGHRTTYGAPFYRLDELAAGDEIVVTTQQGEFTYEVSESSVVSPRAVEVLDDHGDDRLTLTTCHPRYSARERLVVVAHLQDEPAPDIFDELAASAEQAGADLSGAGAANGPAIFWGAMALLVLIGEWAAARWWKRWPAYLLITPVFLVVLFVFFENVSRLLPANI